MINLLVSKIDDIQIVQVGESKISIKHKKCESKKPAKKGGNPLEADEGGENVSIDLGAGAKKFNIEAYTFNKAETSRLFDILYTIRYCTITDKFFGKIKVYIDELEVINSDRHITKTIFNISGTVQDIEKVPSIDAEVQLKNIVGDFEIELVQNALTFAETIETTATTFIDELVSAIDTGVKFVDDALQMVEDGLQMILDAETFVFDIYNGVMARVNRAKRIGETLKLVIALPNDFANLIKKMTNTKTFKPLDIFTTKTKKGVVVKSLNDVTYLSQFEFEKVKKDFVANQLLNLTTAVGEMKQALTKEYTSQQEFDEQIIVCIERLEYTGLSYEKIVNAQQILKAYSNQKAIQKLIDYDVKDGLPLTQIVFSLYGNLNNYDELRLLNNFADNDDIIGNVKVYQK
jgi:prophage DNA circulation protein